MTPTEGGEAQGPNPDFPMPVEGGNIHLRLIRPSPPPGTETPSGKVPKGEISYPGVIDAAWKKVETFLSELSVDVNTGLERAPDRIIFAGDTLVSSLDVADNSGKPIHAENENLLKSRNIEAHKDRYISELKRLTEQYANAILLVAFYPRAYAGMISYISGTIYEHKGNLREIPPKDETKMSAIDRSSQKLREKIGDSLGAATENYPVTRYIFVPTEFVSGKGGGYYIAYAVADVQDIKINLDGAIQLTPQLCYIPEGRLDENFQPLDSSKNQAWQSHVYPPAFEKGIQDVYKALGYFYSTSGNKVKIDERDYRQHISMSDASKIDYLRRAENQFIISGTQQTLPEYHPPFIEPFSPATMQILKDTKTYDPLFVKGTPFSSS